jgi:quercetin dioxygenase-like cupin family protein
MMKGQVIKGHKHNFDHTSFVTDGSVHVHAVCPDGRVIDADFGRGHAYRHFLVLAGVEHEITALEDGTNFYCIYSHRTPQGEISQVQTGWMEGYR